MDHFARLLIGRTAIVTGGAMGIGAACAEALCAAGARVAILDIAAVEGRQLQSRLDGQALFCHTDISSATQVREAFAAVDAAFGTPTLLVNNAGVVRYGAVAELTDDDWETVMGTNLRGAFLCSRAAIPGMLACGSGAIVNISSVQAFVSQSRVAAYTTSKTALLGLTRTLAIDYAPTIRCNAVCPGSVDTPMLRRGIDGSDQAMADCIQMHLAGRIGRPEEVANLVLYLLSDEAAFITGQAIRIDGGLGLASNLAPSGDEACMRDQSQR